MVIKRFFYFLEIMGIMTLLLTGCQKEKKVPVQSELTQEPLQFEEEQEGSMFTETQTPVEPEPSKGPPQATAISQTVTATPPQTTDTPQETSHISPQASVQPALTKHPIQFTPVPESVPPASTRIPSQTLPGTEERKPVSTEEPIPSGSVTQIPKPEPTEEPTHIQVLPTSSPVPEVHTHEFEVSVWELPTCSKGGYYNNVCKSCGFVECITQEPLPHKAEDVVVQKGICMKDTVIQHICKECQIKVSEDTRYTESNLHQWVKEIVDGAEIEYCELCGTTK